MKKRLRSPFKNERSADLTFWLKNGSCGWCDARFATDVCLSVGRTDSKRAIGFALSDRNRPDDDPVLFVLDRHQARELAAYLEIMDGGLRGNKTPGFMAGFRSRLQGR